MFKILSLDGGGIRGIITACWLDKLRDELDGESLYKYFDLIVGTSTGSILASAVACDIVPKENSYIEFYQNYGERIFAKRRRVTASMMDWPLLSLF